MRDFILGFNFAMNIAIAVGVSYVLWRYCFLPWRVMRKDIAALDQRDQQIIARIDSIETLARPAKMAVLSDEELASIERRYRTQRVQS